MVANLPEKKRNALLDRLSLDRLTPHTVTDRPTFEKRLALIRKAGYATDIAEEINCCHCGGVAILDPSGSPLGALWLSGIDKRLQEKQLLAQIRHLQTTAKLIESEVAHWLRVEKQSRAYSPCVAAALETLSRQPHRDIDYAALAKDNHLSYSTLRTLFRAETGVLAWTVPAGAANQRGPNVFWPRPRSLSPKLAARMNFYDQKHLSAIFKKKVGLSPPCLPPAGDVRLRGSLPAGGARNLPCANRRADARAAGSAWRA